MEIAIKKDNSLEVLSQLQLDLKQKPLKTIPNFIRIFENDNNLKDLVRFNELTNSAENARTGKIWNECDDSLVKAYIEQVYQLRNNECYYDAFNIISHKKTYNPIKEIIDNGIWDKKPHIATLLQKYLGCEDNDYTREVARLIFAGGIARLYDNGCKFDFMPIFQGKQGSGKSSFIRWLAINDSWFKEVNDIDGQEGKEAVEGAWICEISELLALTKSREVEAVKSFITRQNDNYRKPYERRVTDNPRKCIFIGTTNRTQYLTDKTGNRRFLPIETFNNGYDLFAKEKECKEEILQCWLEAKHNFDTKNYSLVVNQSLIDEVRNKQNECVEDDWRIGVIEKYIADKTQTCVKDIWDNAFGYSEKPITKKDSNDIVAIFDNEFLEDWEKVSTIRFNNYGRQKGWRKKLKPNEQLLIPIDCDNLPF